MVWEDGKHQVPSKLSSSCERILFYSMLGTNRQSKRSDEGISHHFPTKPNAFKSHAKASKQIDYVENVPCFPPSVTRNSGCKAPSQARGYLYRVECPGRNSLWKKALKQDSNHVPRRSHRIAKHFLQECCSHTKFH